MRKLNQRGVTLVELLVSIVVLAIIAAGLTVLFSSIQYVQASGSFRRSATLAAQREIESLRTSDYMSLTAGSTIDFTSQLPPELPKPKSGTVTVTEPANGIKRVDVVVSYRDRGTDRKVQISSLIGEIGITK